MLMQESNKKKVIYYCSKFHNYLLKSAILLKKKNIIHFDLKENNILIDENRNAPVIIDFGLSINMNLLLSDKIDSYLYTKTFYAYYDKYPPWCLEIILISFIVNNVRVDSVWGGTKKQTKKNRTMKESTFDWTSRIVKKEDLISIIDHYFEKNPVISIISLDTRNKYKTQWIEWIQTIYREKRSSVFGTFMVKKLIQSWTSWDTFGLSVIFFVLLRKFIPNHFLEYQNLLIENILAIPSERENPEIFQKTLSHFFRSPTTIQEKKNWIH
jgi:serine/threonine protein kinase